MVMVCSGPEICPELKGRVRQIWYRNRECSVSEIHEKCEADPIIGSDCPSPKQMSFGSRRNLNRTTVH